MLPNYNIICYHSLPLQPSPIWSSPLLIGSVVALMCVCVCASAYLQQQEQECLLCGLNIFQEETKISGKADNCWEMGVFNHAVFMFVLHFLLLRSISGRMLLLPITEVVQFLISLNLQNLSGQKKYCRKMTIRNAKTSWICVLERWEIKIYRVDLKPIY